MKKVSSLAEESSAFKDGLDSKELRVPYLRRGKEEKS
jgi:hypothetical protein